jgi:2-C-methyl-D-erythritol 4-phosphate cytidylyltransferase
MKRIGLILVAGGSGKRMGNKVAKQFISLNEKPILQYTIESFLAWNKALTIVLVLPEDQIDFWRSIAADHSSYTICSGGKERFHSVKNGLKALREVDYVMVHDGVRPFVHLDTLDRCLEALNEHKGVIPVISPSESVRMINGDDSIHLDRNKIRLVQTPQCFHYKALLEAYSVDHKEIFTDDASVFEAAGNKVHLVEGNRENIKITSPQDLELAKSYLESKQ